MNNSPQNHDCPALMSDGRFLTDYRPSNDIVTLIMKQNGLHNSYEYKEFMIKNGQKIHQMTRNFYESKYPCQSCQWVQPDPFGHNEFWAQYNRDLTKY